MKSTLIAFIAFLFCAMLLPHDVAAQTPVTTDTNTIYIIIKNDGGIYTGRIISQDEREVLADTKELGRVYIPKHEIATIKEMGPNGSWSSDTTMYALETYDGVTYTGKIIFSNDREILLETRDQGRIFIPKYEIRSTHKIQAGEYSVSGEYIASEVFSTRYFISTNSLPIEKGESYIQWNLYGPDFQFGVGKNFGVGIMSSWIGVPIVGSMKYSIPINKKLSCGVGMLAGTFSWAQPDWGGALPFGTFTFGDRRKNLNLSAGYVFLFYDGDNQKRALMSVAGMIKISPKLSLVFDSFIVLPGGERRVYLYPSGYTTEPYPAVAIFIPGLRWQTRPDRAFQFGFGGIYFDNELVPAPVPMVQWYTRL